MFEVRLLDSGSNRLRVLSRVRALLQLSPAECRALVDAGTVTVAQYLIRSQAEELAAELRALGATVEVRVANAGEHVPVVAPYKDLVHAMFEQGNESARPAPPPEVPDGMVEMHRIVFTKVRDRLGSTIPEIFAKGDSEGWDRVHTALTYFISWKLWNHIELTFTERMITGYAALHVDVNNGGFHQYFFNSAGDDWRHVVQVLIDGGDTDGERRFRELLDIFPNGEPSAVRRERWKQLKEMEKQDETAMWDHFRKYTDDYYECPYPSEETFWAAIKPRQDDITPIWI